MALPSPAETPRHEGPGPLDRADPLPLWAQLLADLRARLARGDFDDAFPSETALVAHYGVSRHTVRQALGHLRDDGTVVAGRGRRPRLGRAAEIEQPLGALYSLFSSVARAGMEPRSVVRALDVRRHRAAAAQLGLPPATDLLYLERLRLAAGEPLAVDHVWFPAELAAPLLGADLTHTGFYDELASRTGLRLTGGRETIRARIPTPAECADLGIPRTTAVFAIERLGRTHDRPVEWRRTVVRGDLFGVVAEFSAGAGYRLDAGAFPDAPAAPAAVATTSGSRSRTAR